MMCGALQAGIARRPTPSDTLRAMASLQVGRLVGYSAAGAVVATTVSALSTLGTASAALRPLWTMLQVAALVFGVGLLASGRVPRWLSTLRWPRAPVEPEAATVRFTNRLPSSVKAAGAGACWAAMPCGLLHSALIVAPLADTATQGAAVMLVFAAGSAASLLVASVAWMPLCGLLKDRFGTQLLMRLAGVLLSGSAAFALVQGMSADFQQMLCR